MPTSASKKIKVALLFGGPSPEHLISILSAKNIFEQFDRHLYDPQLVGISRTGRWYLLAEEAFDETLLAEGVHDETTAPPVALVPGEGARGLIDSITGQTRVQPDVYFPILHGHLGEDGSVQGLLNWMGVPYVGPGVLDAAICMDKDIMKQVAVFHGIKVAHWVTVRRHDLTPELLTTVEQEIGYPCFIKPANTGSSIGIHKVKTPADLLAAIDDALRYDTKVLIETAIVGREIECAVLGNESLLVSVPGEIKTGYEFYSYQAKYHDQALRLEMPAVLSTPVAKACQHLAKTLYRGLNCHGLARIDFFLTEDDETLVFNEVNTLPGFTAVSLYPLALGHMGVEMPEILHRLVTLAIENHREQSALMKVF